MFGGTPCLRVGFGWFRKGRWCFSRGLADSGSSPGKTLYFHGIDGSRVRFATIAFLGFFIEVSRSILDSRWPHLLLNVFLSQQLILHSI